MAQAATTRRPRSKSTRRSPEPVPATPQPESTAILECSGMEPPAWAHGRFHWNELRTRDAERAKRFYAATIGWTFAGGPTPDGGTYWVALRNGRPVAGLFPLSSPRFDGVPESWMSFLAVDDVDARVARAIAAGAELVMPVFDVPMVGRIAMMREPGGAGIGWITPVGRQLKEGDAP